VTGPPGPPKGAPHLEKSPEPGWRGDFPGLVRTDIHAGAGDPGRAERVVSRVPLGRAGELAEIAPAIGWLLGPESAYATGTVVRVAGGL
jgi:NAD(P)-dependent dehydrogenase (short-subunit alcohol dehydrogenase family)